MSLDPHCLGTDATSCVPLVPAIPALPLLSPVSLRLYSLRPLWEVSNNLGDNRTMKTRIDGMQAHMMPTLVSMVDHLEISTNSQVGFSVSVRNRIADRRRSMLMIVTLVETVRTGDSLKGLRGHTRLQHKTSSQPRPSFSSSSGEPPAVTKGLLTSRYQVGC